MQTTESEEGGKKTTDSSLQKALSAVSLVVNETSAKIKMKLKRYLIKEK